MLGELGLQPFKMLLENIVVDASDQKMDERLRRISWDTPTVTMENGQPVVAALLAATRRFLEPAEGFRKVGLPALAEGQHATELRHR